MKICLIGTVASSTLNFRKTFIELLVKEGHDVYVFATDFTEKTEKTINSLGATPFKYEFNRGGLNPFKDIKDTIKLKNKLKKINPDIVFSYFSKPVIFGTFAAKMAKVPRIIGMLEGLGYTFTPTPPNEKEGIKRKIIREIQVYLYKISFQYLDRIIFLNPDDPIDLLEKRKIKVKDRKVLGGIGVDLDKFKHSHAPTLPVKFLFIGRLLAEKGIKEFITAAKIIKSKYPDVDFIVLGSIDSENPGSLKTEELNALIKDNVIVYPGHVEDVQSWIHKCSVLVLPSYYREGIPCSIQEAMACGRAIITTDVPGCRETVINKKNGFIIPAHNTKALVEKMLTLIEKKELIQTMGKNSFDMCKENFDSSKQDLKLLNLLMKK